MNTITTIEQMVEALEFEFYDDNIQRKLKDAIQAGRALIDQLKEQQKTDSFVRQLDEVIGQLEASKQEQGEPVAWELGAEVYWNDSPALSDYIRKEGTPLYTHPQPAQPKAEGEHALERALTRLQKRYSELEAKVAAQPKRESLTYEEFKAKADEVFGFFVGLGGYEDAVRALYDIAQREPKREPLTDEHIVDTSWVAARDRYAEAAHGSGKGEA